jgi:hypothetical protein
MGVWDPEASADEAGKTGMGWTGKLVSSARMVGFMMPAKKMRQVAFDSEFLTALSLLGEWDLGSYMVMGVFKSGQAMASDQE